MESDGGADQNQVRRVWVDVDLQHQRVFGRVHGTDLIVSAGSMATLRTKVIEALRPAGGGTQLAELRIYWRHDGREVPVERGAAQWQVFGQDDADRKLRELRQE